MGQERTSHTDQGWRSRRYEELHMGIHSMLVHWYQSHKHPVYYYSYAGLLAAQ